MSEQGEEPKKGLRDLLQVSEEEVDEDSADKKNDEWFKANYLSLIQDYPFLWIAVQDAKVVATGVSKAQVEAKAKKAVPSGKMSYYFIEPSDIRIGLS